jgi:hypothetical protein
MVVGVAGALFLLLQLLHQVGRLQGRLEARVDHLELRLELLEQERLRLERELADLKGSQELLLHRLQLWQDVQRCSQNGGTFDYVRLECIEPQDPRSPPP